MAGHVGVDVAWAHCIHLDLIGLDLLIVGENSGEGVDAYFGHSVDSFWESSFLVIIVGNSFNEVLKQIVQLLLGDFRIPEFQLQFLAQTSVLADH